MRTFVRPGHDDPKSLWYGVSLTMPDHPKPDQRGMYHRPGRAMVADWRRWELLQMLIKQGRWIEVTVRLVVEWDGEQLW